MKKGVLGQDLIDAGEWTLGSVDEESCEELKKETDDQIMTRIKCEEDFLKEEYIEYHNEDRRIIEELQIADSIMYLNYYVSLLKKRVFRETTEIIVKDEGNEIKNGNLE